MKRKGIRIARDTDILGDDFRFMPNGDGQVEYDPFENLPGDPPVDTLTAQEQHDLDRWA